MVWKRLTALPSSLRDQVYDTVKRLTGARAAADSLNAVMNRLRRITLVCIQGQISHALAKAIRTMDSFSDSSQCTHSADPHHLAGSRLLRNYEDLAGHRPTTMPSCFSSIPLAIAGFASLSLYTLWNSRPTTTLEHHNLVTDV